MRSALDRSGLLITLTEDESLEANSRIGFKVLRIAIQASLHGQYALCQISRPWPVVLRLIRELCS